MFDATRAVIILNFVGQTVNHIGNMVTITTDDGLPNDSASPPRATTQPTMLIRVPALIYYVTSKAVRNPLSPTTTPKFTRNPGCANQNIINLLN